MNEPDEPVEEVIIDTCPRCHRKDREVSDDGGAFTEPLCKECRDWLERLSQMDAFDIAYERARANGWED